jgi:hypothetical protein
VAASIFIAHAHEDKRDVADPLAERLGLAGYEVWYDKYSFRVGDSLRRTIDRGLSECDFGVVILSKSFFAKEWPQYELNGLAQRQMASGEPIILPVWHEIDKTDVIRYSPPLADILASRTCDGITKVVTELIGTIQESLDQHVGTPLRRHLATAIKVVPITRHVTARLPGAKACTECGWESLEFAALSLCPACGLATAGCG